MLDAEGNSTGADSGEREQTEILIRRLSETEAALEALISGQVDAVAAPVSAAPILLQHAQEALRQSEERYREIVARNPAIVCELAPDGTIKFANDRTQVILGYEPAALAGRNLWNVLVPGEHRKRAQSLWRRLRQKGMREVELPVVSADGTRHIFSWNSANQHDTDGAIQNVIVFGVDITERKRAEETAQRLAAEQARRAEAEASEERAELLGEASRILSASLDHEATLAQVTALVVPALGDWCAVDIVDEDKTIRRLAVFHSDPVKVKLAEGIRQRYPLSSGMAGGVERVLRTGKSELYPAIATLIAAIVHDPEHLELIRSLGLRSAIIVPLTVRNRTVGCITLVSAESDRSYDESDLRIVEDLANRAAVAIENARLYKEAGTARAEAERAREEAELANKAKSEFLASMSHELRTPLNAIAGYVQLLEEEIQGPINAEQREYLRRVQRSQEHLLGLINGVLNFAKLEAGQVQFEISNVRLSELLLEVDDLITPQVQAKGLHYENKGCETELVARSDRDKTRQIILNILSNAVKFTPEDGSIEVRCGTDGAKVSITIADSGMGIPPDKMDAIFDPFVQIGKQASRQGTGLGLAISRDLARAMQGDLVALSVPEEGSVFTLTLPAASRQDKTASRSQSG